MARSLVMSSGAIFVTLLLVSMHACSARNTPGFAIDNKDVVVDGKTIIQREMNIKVWKRSERLIQESKGHESHEKPSANANQDEGEEDAIVMDYVTPHRKSPIHN